MQAKVACTSLANSPSNSKFSKSMCDWEVYKLWLSSRRCWAHQVSKKHQHLSVARAIPPAEKAGFAVEANSENLPFPLCFSTLLRGILF